MSVLFDNFMKYADSVTMAEWDPQEVKAGIEVYLQDHSLIDIEDELSAEIELLMFKEMPPSTFNAFFAKYAKRQAVESIVTTAKQSAIRRALVGETIAESNYQALSNQLIEASIVLSQDAQNKRWLKEQLDEALLNLKYSAGLSSEISESVARALCEKG